MNKSTEIEGKWNSTKGKLKEKFAILTDSDLLLQAGKEDEMLGRLEVRLGKSKQELEKLISGL